MNKHNPNKEPKATPPLVKQQYMAQWRKDHPEKIRQYRQNAKNTPEKKATFDGKQRDYMRKYRKTEGYKIVLQRQQQKRQTPEGRAKYNAKQRAYYHKHKDTIDAKYADYRRAWQRLKREREAEAMGKPKPRTHYRLRKNMSKEERASFLLEKDTRDRRKAVDKQIAKTEARLRQLKEERDKL